MIVIKNMKMPSSCYDCPFAKNERTNDYGSFCECGVLEDYETINLLEHSKHPNCPLVEQELILDKIRAEIKAYADNAKDEKQAIAFKSCLSAIDYYMTDRSND